MKDKIKLNLERIKEQEEEIIRLEKERMEASAPLITKDDLVGALGQIMLTNSKEIASKIESNDKEVEEIKGDLNLLTTKIESKLIGINSKLGTTRQDLTTLNFTLQNKLTEILNETENKIKKTSEEIKNSFPKEKEYEVNDIKGLKEIINQMGQTISNQTPSQPITVDVLSAGTLVKSGVSRLNFLGATVLQNNNTTDISLTAAATTWGSIVGTLSGQTDLQNALDAKQGALVSGTTIKTVNGVSILGAGDIPLPNGTSISTVTSDITLTISDGTTVVLVDASAGPINITMPSAVSNTGQYNIKKIDTSSNIVTVIATVDNSTNVIIEEGYTAVTLISNNTNYNII